MKSRELILLALIAAAPLSAQVRVWQGTLTLPTYQEGPPDPNPPFDVFATTQFNYPYTLRDNLTNHRAEHAWRAIYLENEYLKCSVLPDIGGHLYTCIDKLNGRPMFYANPSIKKANIGYRGAWAAFGIEFNFPVSHNWVSMSPVDFAFAKHPDGSASVTVGNIDRVYGMDWSVELILRPASTVLEERVQLNNRSDVRHRFYWWNNAGVQVWDDSRICYPMRFTASHGFTNIDTWPVDSAGVDLSVIHNHTDGPVSRFVYGSREPFMGIWHPHTNAGVAHYADYGDLPGKKIWSWGVDADGLDWRKALSDNDSAYVEVQAGLFRNQETYAFLQPRQTIRFSEYWMPVRGLGGIARANLAGVLNMTRRGGTLIAAFNANRRIPEATIRIADGQKELLQQKTDLAPERIWSREIPLPDLTRKYTFELRDSAGAVLLRQTEGEYDWTPVSEIHTGPQASYHFPAPPERTEDDWTQLGKNEELDGNLPAALATYSQGLKHFENSFALAKAAGRLDAALFHYDEAARYLESAQRRDTPDPETAYYLGIAYEGLGRLREARTNFETAQRMPAFHAAACLRLGELLARQNDLPSAARYLNESLQAAPGDPRAAEELIAVLHALGELTKSRSMAAEYLAHFPDNYFLHEELGTPDLTHLAADPARILNIASEYMRLGLYRPALAVLSRNYPDAPADQSEPGVLRTQNHPMIAYYRGYCEEKLGRSGAADFTAASHLSAPYVFPSRPLAIDVLTAALRSNPRDASARYLLGTLYFSRELTDPALAEWEQARKLDPKIPVLHASLGRALLEIKHDPERALDVFNEGANSDPQNPEIYQGLDQSLSILKRPPQQRVAALERYPDLASMPVGLVYELALNRSEAGDYNGAAALFHNRFFPRREGGTNVREVWVEIQLEHALALSRSGACQEALTAAANLGSSVPGLAFTEDGMKPFLDSPRVNYLTGTLQSRCGQPEQAGASYRRAAAANGPFNIVWARRAAEKLGNYDTAAWNKRLDAALAQAQSNLETSSHQGRWLYLAGLIEKDRGNTTEAATYFRQTLLQPDQSLTYHLTRLAQTSPPAK